MLGGAKAAPSPKWNTVGDTHVGRITGEPKPVQVREFNKNGPGELKYWQSSKPKKESELDKALPFQPMMQIMVPVTLKDGSEATFWMEGEKLKALRAALKEAGVSTILEGGLLAVTFTEEKDTGAPFPKKIYTVQYKAPKGIQLA